jgi:hypothetical protein
MGSALWVPADALDLHEVAWAEVRYPRGIEGHYSEPPWPSLHEPAQHFVKRAGDTHETPAL